MHALAKCLLGVVVGAACATPSPPREWAPRPSSDGLARSSSTNGDASAVSTADVQPLEPIALPPRDADSEPAAVFRACRTDADCVTADRVGCCHNGWKSAVAASQTDAYARSFTCPNPHPICAMYVVRDERIARCELAKRLCVLVAR